MNSTLVVEVAGDEVQTEVLVIGDLLPVESDLPLVWVYGNRLPTPLKEPCEVDGESIAGGEVCVSSA